MLQKTSLSKIEMPLEGWRNETPIMSESCSMPTADARFAKASAFSEKLAQALAAI
jgi:hypothetical protein